MSTKILIKRSTVAGAVPSTAQLAAGELALNTADKRVFTNNGTSIVELGTYPSTQAVAGNATVGGTFGVTGNTTLAGLSAGATTLASGAVTGNFSVAGTLTVASPVNSTDAASKGYVDAEIAAVIDAAPGALDTLNELAAAINDDANFATTITNALATKLNLSGGTMTGNIVMGANKVTSTATPTVDDDLTRKGYVDSILGSATSAADSAAAAAVSESNAASSASAASTSEGNAATSETNAAASATSASNSATSAASSETNAASSASSAATSASQASTSATNAGISETNAATSATNAAASETAAATSESNAATSETNAATSETNAAASASAASTSASNAAVSETNAATSETNAASSATSAASSATSAASSATAAAASAANAAASYDSFDDRYLGSKASDPTVDNDGDPLVTGALYYNTTSSEMKIYDGSVWIAASSASIETMEKYYFTATAGQTVFSGTDDNGRTLALTAGVEIVTLNGIMLEPTTDYTATSSAITLTAGASLDDELNIIAFGNFNVADTVSASTGGTFSGSVEFANGATVSGETVLAPAQSGNAGKFLTTDGTNASWQPLSRHRNLIINGAMQVWQRGASFSANGYTADRTLVVGENNGAFNTTKQPETYIDGLGKVTPLRATFSSIPTASGSHIGTRIEEEEFRKFAGKTVTLSFWARASKPIECLAFFFFLSDTGNVAHTYTISTDWTRHEFSWTFSSEMTTTAPVYPQFIRHMGTTVAVNDYIEICGIQLEVGSVATPFEHRSYGEELALCQRYYQKSYKDAVAPGSTSQVTQGDLMQVAINVADFYTYRLSNVRFFERMRATPSITLYNPSTGATGSFWNVSTASTQGSSGVGGVSDSEFGVYSSNSGMTGGQVFSTHWTADAEL